jgi:hypothetical protein
MKASVRSLVSIFLLAAPIAGTAQQLKPNELRTNIAGINSIAAPPQGFDALTASDQDLEYYGFPPRPNEVDSAKAFATWKQAMLASKTRIAPSLQATNIFHGPAKLKQSNANQISNNVSSYNWSGYARYSPVAGYGNSSAYFVYADYVVPIARQAFGACTGGWDYSSDWVGIDGYGSSDVLQAGTESDAFCWIFGSSSLYSPWFEWYPNGETRITNLPAAAGDDYFVEVWSTSATAGHAYLVNRSTNQAVSISFSAPAGTRLVGNSTEWITERPGVNGSLATLTNYVATPFWDAFGETFAGSVNAPYNSTPITMLDNASNPISYPSLLGSYAFVTQDEGSAF